MSSIFSNPNFSLDLINPLFYDKGEILFFKKPSMFLDVEITTDKDTYQPGDEVKFTVKVTQNNTNASADVGDIFLSLYATDDSVFD